MDSSVMDRVKQHQFKDFNADSYNRYDNAAKQAVKAYFAMNRQKTFEENTDRYGVDLVGIDNEFSIEVEIRPNWIAEEFPYPVLNVLERKRKMLTVGNTALMVLSADCKRAIGVNPAILKRHLIPEKAVIKTCHCAEGVREDTVYQIPLDECKKVTLN